MEMYKANISQLNSLLNSVEWDEALRDLDINNAWPYFSSKFNSFLRESIAMSVQKGKKNLYITHEARSLKNKNCLGKRYTRSQSHSDHLAYTQARNAL